ncbi:citrate carrier [Salmonella enterica subsp. enterica]|uniref:Citrate carrier n=1 Tax=Salmonella enterica I TaxID=59201 RepID=A0A447MW61_SALET|nr:citrate carrier [Salmonella enterica subsp. enterica]
MSLSKDNIWKLLAPLVVMGVMLLISCSRWYAAAGLALFCGFRRDGLSV